LRRAERRWGERTRAAAGSARSLGSKLSMPEEGKGESMPVEGSRRHSDQTQGASALCIPAGSPRSATTLARLAPTGSWGSWRWDVACTWVIGRSQRLGSNLEPKPKLVSSSERTLKRRGTVAGGGTEPSSARLRRRTEPAVSVCAVGRAGDRADEEPPRPADRAAARFRRLHVAASRRFLLTC
jgi:hypothetical protein